MTARGQNRAEREFQICSPLCCAGRDIFGYQNAAGVSIGGETYEQAARYLCALILVLSVYSQKY